MLRTLLFISLLACSIPLFSQFDSEQVTFLGNFDVDTIPTHSYGTFNDIWGYTAGGKEYAIMGSASFIHIIDVTDPSNPIELHRIDPDSKTVWRDFKTFGYYLYAVADSSPDGLMVFDLTNLPAEPAMVSQNTDQFTSCHNIFVDTDMGRLYTAGAGGGTNIYDLNADPANPQFLANAPLGGNSLHDIYVKEHIAYCSAGNSGFYIFDLTVPNEEKLMAFTETNGYNHSSWLSEDGTYCLFAEEVPTGLPMGIMDLCDLDNNNIEVNNYFKFPLLAPDQEGATPHNPFIIGHYAYVSYYHDGLVIFDLSDPTNVTRAGYFDAFPENIAYPGYQGTWGCYPFLPSGTILISDMDHGLFALDFLLDETQPPYTPLCTPVSNDEISRDFEILITPNPSDGLVQIGIPENVKSYELNVFNSLGRRVHYTSLKQNFYQEEIDLGNLVSGIYFVQLISGDKEYLQKIILR